MYIQYLRFDLAGRDKLFKPFAPREEDLAMEERLSALAEGFVDQAAVVEGRVVPWMREMVRVRRDEMHENR